MSHAGWIAAMVFGLAHVGITLSPFSLSCSVWDVVYSIVLGLIYADCYEKTNSVYYPMILHSINNVVMVTAAMVLMRVM